MNKPSSTPVMPAQPSESSYSPAALNLFTEYTRASYKAAFGVDPPTYDPTRKTKAWFDTSSGDSAASASYSSLVFKNGDVTVERFTLTGVEAATVNLYGLHTFAEYEVAPSRATHGGQPINPAYLATKQQAYDMAIAFGVRDQFFENEDEVFPYHYPADEDRREYYVQFKGERLPVGLFLQEMSSAGVGAEGEWNLSGAEPNWISKIVTSLPPANPSVPVPQRELLENERIAASPFTFTIYKVDSGTPFQPGAGGSFTGEDRATLTRIEALVTPKAAAATKTSK